LKKQVFPPQGRCHLAEHQNAENTDVGATTVSGQILYYDTIANGATALSRSITTTKRCCIVVVTTSIGSVNGKQFDIERGGVVKTVETTMSAIKFCSTFMYGCLQYATEVLDAGTYQYDLVATTGGNVLVYGCVMKIVAVSAS